MSKMISKMNLISVVQQLPKEDIEVVQSYIEMLEDEIEKLKKQLDYLRSDEYLNQLRFERDMLQHVVDNSEVSTEDKEFIDMTHRNTELLEENQELKKQVAYLRRDIERQEVKITDLENERVPYANEYVDKVKEVLNKAKSKLEEGIRFCENDSQRAFDKCNIAVKREKAVLDLLKEVE